VRERRKSLSLVFLLGGEMNRLHNNKKKNNAIVTATSLFTLAFFLVAGAITPLAALQLLSQQRHT
jgi:hypothetical protein